jgi:hypothetical protein
MTSKTSKPAGVACTVLAALGRTGVPVVQCEATNARERIEP